ncbi:hypothetical protein ACVI1T_005673, partial [Rhizobium redzepovicii]
EDPDKGDYFFVRSCISLVLFPIPRVPVDD